MITRSEAFIPGVGSPRLVVFGTWESSLGGGLDPVVNLQRRVYTCRDRRPEKTVNIPYFNAQKQKYLKLIKSYQYIYGTLFAECALDKEQCYRILLEQIKYPQA